MTATLGLTTSSEAKGSVDNQTFLRPVESVPSADKSHLSLVGPEGQLKVHTAPYRGSFSMVLSEALRSAGLGSKVIVAQLLKGGVSQGPKRSVHLCGQLEWIRPDFPGCLSAKVIANSEESDDYQLESIQAVNEIWSLCKEKLISGSIDQLVLDEIGLAISLGYLQESDVISSLEQRSRSTDVILTGPSIPNGVMNMADQITELRSSN